MQLGCLFGLAGLKRSSTDELIVSDRLLFHASSANQLKLLGLAHKDCCSTPMTQGGGKAERANCPHLNPRVWMLWIGIWDFIYEKQSYPTGRRVFICTHNLCFFCSLWKSCICRNKFCFFLYNVIFIDENLKRQSLKGSWSCTTQWMAMSVDGFRWNLYRHPFPLRMHWINFSNSLNFHL